MGHFIAHTGIAAPTKPLARAFYGESTIHSLHIATDAPRVAMEGVFRAWCLDEGEWLDIKGWLFEWLEDDGVRDDPMAERRALGETARD